MSQSKRLATVILWIARLTGTAIVIFVLFYLIMDLMGSEESFSEGLGSTDDLIAFICFPLSTIVGLSLAWKREGLGGLISTLGFICLFVVRTDLASSPVMTVMALPGLLYLVYWIISKKSKKTN